MSSSSSSTLLLFKHPSLQTQTLLHDIPTFWLPQAAEQHFVQLQKIIFKVFGGAGGAFVPAGTGPFTTHWIGFKSLFRLLWIHYKGFISSVLRGWLQLLPLPQHYVFIVQYLWITYNPFDIFHVRRYLLQDLYFQVCAIYRPSSFVEIDDSCNSYCSIDLMVTRPLIAHLSLYTRLKPTCDRKIGIMGLLYVYIFSQWDFNCGVRGPSFKPWWSTDF